MGAFFVNNWWNFDTHIIFFHTFTTDFEKLSRSMLKYGHKESFTDVIINRGTAHIIGRLIGQCSDNSRFWKQKWSKYLAIQSVILHVSARQVIRNLGTVAPSNKYKQTESDCLYCWSSWLLFDDLIIKHKKTRKKETTNTYILVVSE